MSDAVLYQNSAATITVLDLPRSIECGQASSHQRLLSIHPLSCPYPSTEPRASKTQQLLLALGQHEREHHQSCQEFIAAALRHVTPHLLDREWCLPRCILPPESFGAGGVAELPVVSHAQECLTASVVNGQVVAARGVSPPLILSSIKTELPDLEALKQMIVHNPFSVNALLEVSDSIFQIPPQSTFLCSSIDDGSAAFTAGLRSRLVSSDAPHAAATFDLILLDPPWTNRSARRARAYRTVENQAQDPFAQVLPVAINHLASTGIIAIWTTNKWSIRQQVVQSLEAFGFGLCEQWIWAKVTGCGEPVTSLHGLWRKPYEVLLLFRAHEASSQPGQKVIITVPDIHSRKPCLKHVIEPLLPKPYRALEVFARNLTAGWWAWGDEALLFQEQQHWTHSVHV